MKTNPFFAQIKTKLGTPAYETSNIAIYQGDCLELMSNNSFFWCFLVKSWLS